MSGFCGACGAAKATADQRFCQQCGAPSVPTAPPVAAPAAAPPGPVDYAVPAPLPGPTGRAPVGRILGVGAAVAALTAGGFVAWQVLGSSGGADTPEDAVRQFVTATVEQDVVGALAMVNPGEVEGLDGVYEAARERAEDEGLVGGDSITDALDVTIDGLELDVDEQGDFSAFVTLDSADYTVRYEPDKVPDRLDFVREEFPEPKEWTGDVVDLLEEEVYDPEYDAEPGISTIKVDGHWYVSAVGSLLDNVARNAGAYEDRDYSPSSSEYDAIGEDVEPIVGKDPEEALENLADAFSDQDFTQLLANFPADQVRALRPYADVVEDLLADEGVTLDGQISDLDLSTDDLSGDLVKVTIDNATGSVSGSDEYSTLSGEGSIDGRCFEGSTYESSDDYDDYDDGRVCIDGEIVDYTGIDEVFVVMREVDGGYQLDPLATAVEYGLGVVDAIPDSAIDDALGEICYDVKDGDSGCPE